MPKLNLTDTFIRSADSQGRDRIEYSDTKVIGLKLRVTKAGGRTFIVQKKDRTTGKNIAQTLGPYPTVTLADARRRAADFAAAVAEGRNPVAEAKAAQEAARRELQDRVTVREVLAEYDRTHIRRNLRQGYSANQRLVQLQRVFGHKLDRPVGDIDIRDARKVIDGLAAEGKGVMANRIRAAVMHFTRWAWERDHLAEPFGAKIGKVKESSRDIVLTPAEVRAILDAAAAEGDVWGALWTVLAFTGQRQGEIRTLRWAEVDFDARTITKTGAQTKNRQAHVTHLTAPVVAALRAMYAVNGGREYVFTFAGDAPVAGLGKITDRIRARLGDTVQPGWTAHDLRTAMATALAEAGESEAVVDKVLNHVATASATSGVSRVYNRAALLDQRRIALDRWADMVTGSTAKVVQLRG